MKIKAKYKLIGIKTYRMSFGNSITSWPKYKGKKLFKPDKNKVFIQCEYPA